MRTNTSNRFLRTSVWLAVLCLCAGATLVRAQQTPVTAQVEIVERSKTGDRPGASAAKNQSPTDAANVVVWLTPLDDAGQAATPARQTPQLVQRNKTFEPHVLVVQVGSEVQFPNKDPYLHNVFSLFDGKRFDLGFYEAGSSRSVHFDKAGISFLFCNIHPDMSAVVVAVETPYFALSDRSGRVAISNVPNGRYRLRVWYERSVAQDLDALSRMVTISDSARSLVPIQVIENPDFTFAHKNKYGQDYVPPSGVPY
jgi:plastocyanin